MVQINSEVRHVVNVKLANGTAVTGLTGASFTLTLRRRSGATLISSAETVTVLEIGTGDYWVYYTPTVAALYVLSVVPTNVLNLPQPQEPFQDDISPATSATGPYLTTAAAVRAAFGFAVETKRDAQIDALLPQVTDQFQTYCGRNFFQSTVTEYPAPMSACVRVLLAGKPPIASVTSLHFSSSLPRVYDATTLLVEGTDFIVSEDGQWIKFASPRYPGAIESRCARMIYVGGYAVIPGDLERAAQEVIGVKVQKSQQGGVYHFLSESRADGGQQGFRWDDITPNVLMVLDSYRLQAFA